MIYYETEEYEKGFAQYFQDYLLLDLKRMEKIRRKYLRYFKITSIIIIPIAIFIILYLLKYAPGAIQAYIIVVLITYFICSIPNYLYRNIAKGKLMPKIVGFFGDFFYKNNGKINEELVLSSRLIPHYTSYHSEDKIIGTYKDVSIEMAETKFTKTSGTSKNRRTVTLFKGVMILLSMNKDFDGQTIVLKDRGSLGNFLTDKFSSFENVKLEDPHFEGLFEVYSSDQIEARYLLTTSFMERLIKLSETFGNKGIQCSFFDNHLMITIPVEKNMFEPASIFSHSCDLTGIKIVLREIYYTLNIVDILKLNQKIGL